MSVFWAGIILFAVLMVFLIGRAMDRTRRCPHCGKVGGPKAMLGEEHD